MGLPLRPYITTGVAIAGTAALAVAPVTLPPIQEDRTIRISAATQPESLDRQVRLLSDEGILDSLASGDFSLGGLFDNLFGDEGLGGLFPDFGDLGGLGGLLGNVFVDLDQAEASFQEATDEATGILIAELAVTPQRLQLVVSQLLGGNPDAENHLVEAAILLVLDVLHPFVHAGLNHLNPTIGDVIHVAYDFVDGVARSFAANFTHRIPDTPVRQWPLPEEPEGEAVVAAATALPEADDDGSAGASKLATDATEDEGDESGGGAAAAADVDEPAVNDVVDEDTSVDDTDEGSDATEVEGTEVDATEVEETDLEDLTDLGDSDSEDISEADLDAVEADASDLEADSDEASVDKLADSDLGGDDSDAGSDDSDAGSDDGDAGSADGDSGTDGSASSD